MEKVSPESGAKDTGVGAEGNRGRLLAVSLFLLVPAMYVFGKGYWNSWLVANGLTAATFPLSVEQAVYSAYEAVLLSGLPFIKVMTSVGLMLLTLFLLWAISALMLFLWGFVGARIRALAGNFTKWFARLINKNKSAVAFTARSYVMGATPMLLWAGALYLYLILLIPLLLGHYIGKWQGEKSAEELRQRIGKAEFKEGDQLIVIVGSQSPLYLIACSEIGCGGANAEGSKFVTWDRIERIEAP